MKIKTLFISIAIAAIPFASETSANNDITNTSQTASADEQSIKELRASFWKRWFQANNRKYDQSEHNRFYNIYNTETNTNSANDTTSFLNFISRFDSGKAAAKSKAELIENRKAFWTRWFNSNQVKFGQTQHNKFYDAYNTVFNTSNLGEDTSQFLTYINKYDSIKGADSLRTHSELLAFKRSSDVYAKQFKHTRDKFGEYEFWEKSSILVSGGYRIDLIVSPPGSDVAHFYVTKNTPACFDDDARIVFLLKNGEKVELESTSGFNCNRYFNSLTFVQNEFSAPISAVRIDHGSHATGFYDFNVSTQKGTSLHLMLNKIEWLQLRLYEGRKNANNK